MNSNSQFKEYFEKTEDSNPNKLLIKFIRNIKIEPAKAIDIGCGAGRDSIFLIKNGWHVLGIDKENVENIITRKLADEEKNNFKFENQTLEELNLNNEKVKLISSFWTLPFCKRTEFDKMWKQVSNCIEKGGYFVGNFFGKNDEWNVEESNRTFLNERRNTQII